MTPLTHTEMGAFTKSMIPGDMCVPCAGPKIADGSSKQYCQHIPFTVNPAIIAGCWARFAAWPLSQDNPPRQVDHLTAHGCAVLEPCPGWRTYARTMDLVVVTPEELREYTAAGNCLLGCPVINNAPDGDGSDS